MKRGRERCRCCDEDCCLYSEEEPATIEVRVEPGIGEIGDVIHAVAMVRWNAPACVGPFEITLTGACFTDDEETYVPTLVFEDVEQQGEIRVGFYYPIGGATITASLSAECGPALEDTAVAPVWDEGDIVCGSACVDCLGPEYLCSGTPEPTEATLRFSLSWAGSISADDVTITDLTGGGDCPDPPPAPNLAAAISAMEANLNAASGTYTFELSPTLESSLEVSPGHTAQHTVTCGGSGSGFTFSSTVITGDTSPGLYPRVFASISATATQRVFTLRIPASGAGPCDTGLAEEYVDPFHTRCNDRTYAGGASASYQDECYRYDWAPAGGGGGAGLATVTVA